MDIPFFDDAAIQRLTPWPALVDAVGDGFRAHAIAPERHIHEITGTDGRDVTMLIMPAWIPDAEIGVKLALLARSNAGRGLPTLHGLYVLFCGETGRPRALFDAGALTARRTAAASALASRALSRADARTLLVIGTGRVARQLAAAHCAVRPIEEVRIWGRTPEHAIEAAAWVREACGVACVTVPTIEAAAAGADIITSATPTPEPLLFGRWVPPGTHVDLVGAFKPSMCEADPELIARAGQVFVDTVEGARVEASELLRAAAAGVFSFDEVAGDLYRIAACGASLRRCREEITIFKSVGAALEDLAAARLCLERARGEGPAPA